MTRQIILINLEKPRMKDLDDDLLWFCNSFGLSSGRDVENTSTRIVMSMLDRISEDEEVTSKMIADALGINLSRVNHHLRSLIDSGLVYRKKRTLCLRGGSLRAAVQEMRRDSDRIFDDLEKFAADIDRNMGIKNR
ncbi:MAG: winged helix-turn-helix transcriptional regulator [Methanosarcinaceae archaeon]|nr:winged helix-turn-helix transcriptional regulator [Methanosarcinaceae archaeon]